MTHDKFCDYHGETMHNTRPCTCSFLAEVRADERSQIVRDVNNEYDRIKSGTPASWTTTQTDCFWCDQPIKDGICVSCSSQFVVIETDIVDVVSEQATNPHTDSHTDSSKEHDTEQA